MQPMMISALVFSAALFSSISSPEGVPVKFMCDLCESNWMQCIMKCHMEEYMTRHNYRFLDFIFIVVTYNSPVIPSAYERRFMLNRLLV